mmetsp:Transcript_11078/g.16766  ORF Transcript_11078/g.16766 Transcript_11078/m.16766 type:complete len:81 (+) Transcript_11078:982-1224(+)
MIHVSRSFVKLLRLFVLMKDYAVLLYPVSLFQTIVDAFSLYMYSVIFIQTLPFNIIFSRKNNVFAGIRWHSTMFHQNAMH